MATTHRTTRPLALYPKAYGRYSDKYSSSQSELVRWRMVGRGVETLEKRFSLIILVYIQKNAMELH